MPARITKRRVDDYATAKLAEGKRLAETRVREGNKGPRRGLSAWTINTTITRLAQILGDAPCSPRLAGTGLRIGEALELRWGDVNLPRGTLNVRESKTESGRRTIAIPAALLTELRLWRADTKHAGDGDYVFPTERGERDNRQNVRQRLLLPAVANANAELVKAGIEPMGSIGLHSLRRTFASLRFATGADPVKTAAALGHKSGRFRLEVYATALEYRERLTHAELRAFDEAVDWAQMGTNVTVADVTTAIEAEPDQEKSPVVQGFSGMERAGLEPATPSLQIRLRGGLGGSAVVWPRTQARCCARRRRRWSRLVSVI